MFVCPGYWTWTVIMCIITAKQQQHVFVWKEMMILLVYKFSLVGLSEYTHFQQQFFRPFSEPFQDSCRFSRLQMRILSYSLLSCSSTHPFCIFCKKFLHLIQFILWPFFQFLFKFTDFQDFLGPAKKYFNHFPVLIDFSVLKNSRTKCQDFPGF